MRITLLLLMVSINLYSQNFTSTLPIVVINTNGQGIPDHYKLLAAMKIIHHPDKSINTTTDVANIYNGNIGIETRGSSSQDLFPKKSFGFETRLIGEEENEVNLFDWPKESDYILYASYNEKSFMNNVLTMKLSRDMGMYASRTQYVDVVLNGEYQGIYVLMEKIKRAKGRVDIAKLDSADVSGDELTGGYIVKIDKSTGSNLGSFQSNYYVTNGSNRPMFLYEAPKSIHGVQKNYIRNYINEFESALIGPNFADPNFGYEKYIDVSSFIKLFLINEITANVDAYRISTYMYKDKNSKDGKLTLGPPWDYDLSYGNADYCGAPAFNIFSYQFNTRCSQDWYQVPFWWDRLMQDSSFRKKLYEEYSFQRTDGALQWSHITNVVDSLREEIKTAQQKNFQIWPVLGEYVWPNPYPIPATWEGEINELLTWFENRLIWLDGRLEDLVNIKEAVNFSISLKSNPITESSALIITSPKNQSVSTTLVDINGRVLSDKSFPLTTGYNEINFIYEIMERSDISISGIFVLKVVIGDKTYLYKVIK